MRWNVRLAVEGHKVSLWPRPEDRPKPQEGQGLIVTAPKGHTYVSILLGKEFEMKMQPIRDAKVNLDGVVCRILDMEIKDGFVEVSVKLAFDNPEQLSVVLEGSANPLYGVTEGTLPFEYTTSCNWAVRVW